jgi:hypothetical protein
MRPSSPVVLFNHVLVPWFPDLEIKCTRVTVFAGTGSAVLSLAPMEDQTMTRATARPEPGGAGLRSQNKQQERLKKQDQGQGIIPDDRGQDQPADKRRAEQDSGLRAQKEAARQIPPSPGQPAHGE